MTTKCKFADFEGVPIILMGKGLRVTSGRFKSRDHLDEFVRQVTGAADLIEWRDDDEGEEQGD